LEAIKSTLGVGQIYFSNNDPVVTLRVKSKKELQIIIDHFDKYPLVTAKHSDFILFKECFKIIKTGEHLTEEGFLKVLALRSNLNLGLSNKLKDAFPNLITISRPKYIFKGISSPI